MGWLGTVGDVVLFTRACVRPRPPGTGLWRGDGKHDGDRQRNADADGRNARFERHAESTGSIRARAILDRWDEERSRFWTVIPRAAVAARTAEAEEAATAGAAD